MFLIIGAFHLVCLTVLTILNLCAWRDIPKIIISAFVIAVECLLTGLSAIAVLIQNIMIISLGVKCLQFIFKDHWWQ